MLPTAPPPSHSPTTLDSEHIDPNQKSKCQRCLLPIRGDVLRGETISQTRILISEVEDHPSGYPRFAALTSSDPSFFAVRRFATLRARMLFKKQDLISELEAQLQKIDRNEMQPIFRCSYRQDNNPERKAVLEQLDTVMLQYDHLCQRTREVLATRTAASREVQNLDQWVNGFGCIAWSETTYLAHRRDLMALGPAETDRFLDTVAHKVEDMIIWISRAAGLNLRNDCSYDPGVHIFSGRLIKTLSRSILAIFASSFLLIPIVILTLTSALAIRLIVVISANAIFTIVVSVIAEVKMGELFMASAAYAAVMIVYISGSNQNIDSANSF